MTSSLRILHALRARLLMEQGLGITFPSGALENERLTRALAQLEIVPIAATPQPMIPARSPVVPNVSPKPVPAPPPDGATAMARIVPVSESSLQENADKERELAPLRSEALACTACPLCAKRTKVVWGEGTLDAKVMFIGEGPGRDEDLEGRPFVGRSGRVLTDIIEKGMRTPRGDVYIANVVKCRPPGNREPKPDEVAACSRYLNKQIEVIQPKVIVAVGGVAGCALLQLPPKTSGLRGKWHMHRGVPLRVIFHPSYLLRQRSHDNERTKADHDTWKDIVEVMEKLKEQD